MKLTFILLSDNDIIYQNTIDPWCGNIPRKGEIVVFDREATHLGAGEVTQVLTIVDPPEKPETMIMLKTTIEYAKVIDTCNDNI